MERGTIKKVYKSRCGTLDENPSKVKQMQCMHI